MVLCGSLEPASVGDTVTRVGSAAQTAAKGRIESTAIRDAVTRVGSRTLRSHSDGRHTHDKKYGYDD